MNNQTVTIEKYFISAGDREEDLRQLDELIRQVAPGLEPFLLEVGSATMLAYGPYHYKYASGREGDWAVIALANQKHYMSLYVCMAKDGQYLPEIYSDKLGKVSCGKSCIRFKKLKDLNLEAVRAICQEAATLSKDTSNFQI